MEIPGGILIMVGRKVYALFDDGEYYQFPGYTIDPDEDPLIFQSFDELVEFITISSNE